MKVLILIVMSALPWLSSADELGLKSGPELIDDSEVICRTESTKRGQVDENRLARCLSTQGAWASDVIRISNENDAEFYRKFSYPYCYGKSTKRGITNPGLLYSCLSIEIDAHKDVMYYVDRLGGDKVAPIVRSELGRYGSWNMVRFKVRNDLDPPP